MGQTRITRGWVVQSKNPSMGREVMVFSGAAH